MKVSAMFPSNYFKAADLGGKPMQVQIERVVSEEVGQSKEVCPVAYFLGHEKGLVLNRTNANVISAAFGDESDDWVGAEVVLYSTTTTFQGRTVDAIRVRLAPPQRRQQASPAFQAMQQAAPRAPGQPRQPIRQPRDEGVGPREFAPPEVHDLDGDDIPF